MILWTLLSSLAYGGCVQPKPFADIASDMTRALERFQMDQLEVFAQEAAEIREDWACLDEVLLPSNLPSIHEFEAYYSFAIGDADRVESAIAGWLQHTSFEVLSYELNNTALAQSLVNVKNKAPSLIVPFQRRDPSTTTLDGTRTSERHLQQGALLQLTNEDGRVQQSTYVHAGDALPSGWIEPHQNLGRFGRLEIPGGRSHAVQSAEDCDPTGPAFMTYLDNAIDAFSQMDSEGFTRQAMAAERAVPCSPVPMSNQAVAALMRVRGLRTFMDGQSASTQRHFQAALALQPGYALPSAVATPGSEIHTLYELAKRRPASTQIPFVNPKGYRTLVNGVLSTTYVPHIPNIIQLLDKKDRIALSLLLAPGERLPTPFSRVVESLDDVPQNRPAQDQRASGTLISLRPGLSFGSLHRFYAEGLRGDGNPGWAGYGTGFTSEPTFGSHLAVSYGQSLDSVDTGLSLSFYPWIYRKRLVTRFEFEPEGYWRETDSLVSQQGKAIALFFDLFGRKRFRVHKHLDIGIYGQIGLGVFGPYLPDIGADAVINCGNEQNCPMGDTGTISVNAGAGPSLTAHISRAFRITIDVPFSVLVQAQEAKFNGGVGALERTQNQHVAEDVCNPRFDNCSEILAADSSTDWLNNAYSYDALGPGYSPIGFMGSVFIQLEFILPKKKD